ncbi:MAG: hypothetical protein AAF790_04590 [Planctomycetota bacterium]
MRFVLTSLAIAGLALAAAPAANAQDGSGDVLNPTVLPVGTSVVNDGFAEITTPGPDLILGLQDINGNVVRIEDDSEAVFDDVTGELLGFTAPLFGDGLAPQATFVPFNGAIGSESFAFSIAGFYDGFDQFEVDETDPENPVFTVSLDPAGEFAGATAHTESGDYEVTIAIFDFEGAFLETIEFSGTLQEGVIDSFDSTGLDNTLWAGGDFDIFVNNQVGLSDLDFYKFEGLTPGEEFTATVDGIADPTLDNDGVFDSVLGQFDDTGALIDFNDDIDFDNDIFNSSITGIVPANGELIFGIGGFELNALSGSHSEVATYTLTLEADSLVGVSVPGDYDGNGTVGPEDLAVWIAEFGMDDMGGTVTLAADGNGDGIVDGADYAFWRGLLPPTPGAVGAVPEPAAAVLVGLLLAAVPAARRRS